MATVAAQRAALRRLVPDLPDRALRFPQLRFMGSKYRLLPWLHEVLSDLDFDSALDAFSGFARHARSASRGPQGRGSAPRAHPFAARMTRCAARAA
jgi:hypothetical protein